MKSQSNRQTDSKWIDLSVYRYLAQYTSKGPGSQNLEQTMNYTITLNSRKFFFTKIDPLDSLYMPGQRQPAGTPPQDAYTCKPMIKLTGICSSSPSMQLKGWKVEYGRIFVTLLTQIKMTHSVTVGSSSLSDWCEKIRSASSTIMNAKNDTESLKEIDKKIIILFSGVFLWVQCDHNCKYTDQNRPS